MATNPDTTAKALTALVAFLQDKMPDPALDDIDIMLNGGIDDTGAPTTAMDRRIRRNARVGQVMTTEQRSAFDARFPNHNRLR